jgi:hypothetical protein
MSDIPARALISKAPLPALHTRRRTAALLAVGLALSPAAWAAETAPSPSPITDCADARLLPPEANAESRRITCEIPDKYREDVSTAEFVGHLIRLHDVAAWQTTDALLEAGALKQIPGEGRGWLTLQDGDKVTVRYFAQVDDQTVAIASAQFDAASGKAAEPRRLSPPEPMSEREAPLMKAKLHALSSQPNLCTNEHANSVVIESREGGHEEILVFVMSAWKDHAQAPMGGYHMFRYTPDGQTQLSHFSQTRACPMADLKNLPGKAADAEFAGLAVTHLSSATPTMFHVFMSLQYRLPMFVMTTQNGLKWRVEDGRIHLLADPALDDVPTEDDAADATQGPIQAS